MQTSVKGIFDYADFVDLSNVFLYFSHILVVSYLPQLRAWQFGRAYYDLMLVFQELRQKSGFKLLVKSLIFTVIVHKIGGKSEVLDIEVVFVCEEQDDEFEVLNEFLVAAATIEELLPQFLNHLSRRWLAQILNVVAIHAVIFSRRISYFQTFYGVDCLLARNVGYLSHQSFVDHEYILGLTELLGFCWLFLFFLVQKFISDRFDNVLGVKGGLSVVLAAFVVVHIFRVNFNYNASFWLWEKVGI
jgi:hypothetical protein